MEPEEVRHIFVLHDPNVSEVAIYQRTRQGSGNQKANTGGFMDLRCAGGQGIVSNIPSMAPNIDECAGKRREIVFSANHDEITIMNI
uniref:Uncharacterized protein n=1 Tax=Salix viminalis TaxID=40686 RepID=A0A6N2LST0_SALVM